MFLAHQLSCKLRQTFSKNEALGIHTLRSALAEMKEDVIITDVRRGRLNRVQSHEGASFENRWQPDGSVGCDSGDLRNG